VITFAQLGSYGRLGNQLFQYAALKSLGLKKGYEVKIPYLPGVTWHGQRCLLNNFNLEAEYLVPEDIYKIQHHYMEPNHNAFDENFFNLEDNTSIHGFFQFIDYFKDHESDLRREFTPQKNFIDSAHKTLDPLRAGGYEVVSVHIRRGDMMTVMYPATGIHPDDVYGKEDIFDEDTIYGKYINKAMSLFEDRKVKYLVFSGGNRSDDDTSDIAYIRKVFNNDRFIISDTNDPIQDFSLIMSCDHNIACHQTSFGWWAAYLNDNQNKIVTAPEHYYFAMSKEKNDRRIRNGALPSDWTIIE